MEKNGSPKPIFETDDERTSFAATIFIHPGFVVKESLPSGKNVGKDNGKNVGKDNGKNVGKDNGKDKFTITNNEEQVLAAIRNNPQITIPLIATTTGLGERTVSRIIKELKSNGVLIREGTRNGKWVILK